MMIRQQIDKAIVQKRFESSLNSYNSNARPQSQIIEHFWHLLKQQCFFSETKNVLEIGCGTGMLSQKLLTLPKLETLHVNDLVENSFVCDNEKIQTCWGDAETALLPNELDLVASASTFQWFEDLDSFFLKISRHLRAQGMFCFTTFGPKNFQEIRKLTGKGLHYPTISEIRQLLGRHFDLIHSSETVMSNFFKHPKHVLRHIRNTGVNGTAESKWTPGKLKHFCQTYENLFLTNQGVSLTFHPYFFIAKKK